MAQHIYLQAARRGRVLSSWPELDLNDETKKLDLTLDEIKKNGWIKVKEGPLYELEETDSPYEKHIETIAGYHKGTTFLALTVLVNKIWNLLLSTRDSSLLSE